MFTVLPLTFTPRGPAEWRRPRQKLKEVWSEAILAPFVSQTDLECVGPWQGDRQGTVKLREGRAANWRGNRAALWTKVGSSLSGAQATGRGWPLSWAPTGPLSTAAPLEVGQLNTRPWSGKTARHIHSTGTKRHKQWSLCTVCWKGHNPPTRWKN